MQAILTNLQSILANSGFAQFFVEGGYRYVIMIAVACILLYLAIVHKFEPLLLLPIGFGMLMANLPLDNIIHMEIFINETQHINWQMLGESGGLADYLYLGVKLGIYPPLIFLGIGTMTDFEPLIARPSSLLMGAAAQVGIFVAYIGARLLGFTPAEAASIGIIGGADGPTAIFTTSRLAPALLGSVAVAAYCYMALVPVIQPPIMKLLTTDKERKIVMQMPRKVSRTEKILFPIIVTLLVSLLLPDAAILVGCLMMGNLMKETGVVERITKTAGNELMNIITIFLGFSVGCTTNAETFLTFRTVEVIALGIVAFAAGTAGGVLLGKVMCFVTHGKINPLIGSAGVSAVPMAARVSQKVGQEYNPSNYLLMHAMGPNVAGVIGSAVAAGILTNMCKGMKALAPKRKTPGREVRHPPRRLCMPAFTGPARGRLSRAAPVCHAAASC